VQDRIIIRGARVHNLKSIDVEIPHDTLTVLTGVSGSGKSSLAFDTIYAEGQRRYVESLSAYARQFLERMEKPDADHIDGLAPAVAIQQKNSTRNPRSTVATSTEIHDYLRLLFARCGVMHCIDCGGLVQRDSVDEIAAAVLALGDGTRLNVLFPVAVAATQAAEPTAAQAKSKSKTAPQKSAAKKSKSAAAKTDASPQETFLRQRLLDLRQRGFTRLYQNGRIFEFSTPESLLDLNLAQPFFVLADRIVVAAEERARIVDAAELAYRETGSVLFEVVSKTGSADAERKVLRFSTGYTCRNCQRAYREPEPLLFSFNNPQGACPRCEGFGNTVDYDLNRVIPDKNLSIDQDAIHPWRTRAHRSHLSDLRRFAREHGIPLNVAWKKLPQEQQDLIWNGDGLYLGIRGFFEYLERKKYKLHVRVLLSKYRGYAACPLCRGQRLRAEATAVRIAEKNICDLSAMTIAAARRFLDALTLPPVQMEIAGRILEELRARLRYLDEVGLDYLTLERQSSTLSGGEAQRVQLAASLGSQLVGAMYVLDEPSIGLHPRDTARLVRILKSLRDLGNTILVVEHDPEVMRAADRLLDLGPGAGELGGKLLACGSVEEILHAPQSLTGKYLSGELAIPVPVLRREPGRERLRLTGARAHNLRSVDVEIPLGMFVCVSGVSGSGKSTLVHDVLYHALAEHFGGAQTQGEEDAEETTPGGPERLYDSIDGMHHLSGVVLVDQSPIGRTPRSNPVTYLKAFDAIRELYASLPDARARKYSAGYFSFNVPGGRCDVCDGSGTVTVEMQFLADVELPCEECNGTRYKARALEIRYKGKNIHDVLSMTVHEALQFFAGHPKIQDRLRVLDDVGLGYIRLGQSATTLSGGEAQRVKLAAHLANAKPTGGRTGKSLLNRLLYILDEPTTGLHFDDVSKLLSACRQLIDNGGSLLVIEHNLDVLKTADWIVDLGPEGGSGGGRIVATGTPEEIAATPESHTGQWLRTVLTAQSEDSQRDAAAS
jgi:excinuclease ABC subunit A